MMHHGPHFIGLGAPHAGLPQVTAWLEAHPAIINHIRAFNFFNTSHFERHGYIWYEAQVKALTQASLLIGDCSAGYLSHKETPYRIVSAYPAAKLFVIVRHPLYRALAAYQAHQHTDRQAVAVRATEYLALHPSLQTDSWYADALAEYFSYYSPLQLHIMVYEDLVAAPLDEMQRLYQFLEIDKNFIPKALLRYAPAPDEPKRPSLLYRGRRLIGRALQKLHTRNEIPLFPDDKALLSLQTESERSLFIDSFRLKTIPLSDYMARDMVAFWELDQSN